MKNPHVHHNCTHFTCTYSRLSNVHLSPRLRTRLVGEKGYQGYPPHQNVRLLEFGLGISFILSVHNWCMQLPHGASLQARTNHAIMTGQVHSSCDANLGTSMIDLGLPRSKIQKSVENTAFHRTSTNCHPPRLPPGPFERPRQDAIFVAATFLSGGLGRAAKKANHFSPILACTHAFHCVSPTVDIQPSEPQQKVDPWALPQSL